MLTMGKSVRGCGGPFPTLQARSVNGIRKQMRIVRHKLPQGWCYPLKASVLERVIGQAGLRTPVTLFLHHSAFWAERPLFHADFHLAGAVLNAEELFWVGCRSVKASDCIVARSFVEGEILPIFADWAVGLEKLDSSSTVRREKQKFVQDWVGSSDR